MALTLALTIINKVAPPCRRFDFKAFSTAKNYIMLNDGQKGLIDRVLAEKGFKNYTLSFNEGSKRGDNYLGRIHIVKARENVIPHRSTSFVLKRAEECDKIRQEMPLNEIYKREIYLYETVLPIFEKFQTKMGLKYPFKSYAKLYGSSVANKDEYLLMENIRDEGFHMMERRQTMDEKHIMFGFRELAKFHSISLAMSLLEPDTFKVLAGNVPDFFALRGEITKSNKNSVVAKLEEALKFFDDHPEAIRALQKCQADAADILQEGRNKDNHLVIIHGDAWCNNMMFKYNDGGNPVSMRFLDWQLAKAQSPVMDLYYFLFLSASKETLYNHRVFLNSYHDLLRENLRSVDCDIDSVLPYELLMDHWRKQSRISLINTLPGLQTVLKDPKDVKHFNEIVAEGKTILGNFYDSKTESDEFRRRLRNVVFMLLDEGLL